MVQCDSSNRPVKEGTTRPVMTFIQTDVSQRRDIFEDFLYRTGTRQVDASGVTAGSCGRFCVEGRGYIPRARCQQAGRAGTDNVPKRDNARRQMPVRVLGPIRTGWLVRVPPLYGCGARACTLVASSVRAPLRHLRTIGGTCGSICHGGVQF